MDTQMKLTNMAHSSNETDFLRCCHDLLGPDRVSKDGKASAEHTGADNKRIPAEVFPVTVDEVRHIARLACTHGISLYPTSRGKNWGLGSRVPARDGCVLLNLSLMRAIREINLEFGYAVVEPGVSQADLARELERRQAPFFVDVTGSGGSSSLVGNALERGVAYNTQRTRNTRALEVVLADGSVITTGFQDPRVRTLNHLYDHGIGPDLRGLFFQSGLGCVTAMTIDLMPIPDATASVNLNLDTEQLPGLLDELRKLCQEGVITGIPHIANRLRTFSTAVPILRRKSKGRWTEAAAERLLHRLLPREWTTIIGLSGPSDILQSKLKLVRKRIGRRGDLRVMTPFRQRMALALTRWAAPPLHRFLSALEEVNALGFGKPTEDTVGFLDYRESGPISNAPVDPDRHPRGFLYILPLCPLSGGAVKSMLPIIETTSRNYGYDAAVTFNVLDSRVLEAVISVTTPKDPQSWRKALRFGNELLERMAFVGAAPYRLHVDQMKECREWEGAWGNVMTRLNRAFDAGNVFSPGRYGKNADRI